jgi:hypothetical protein
LENGLDGNYPICRGAERHLSGEPQSAPVGSEGNFAIIVRSLGRDRTTDLAIRSLRSATEFALAVARPPENAVASSRALPLPLHS